MSGRPAPEGVRRGWPDAARLAGLTVLLVEDDDDSRELMTVILSFCGARVMAASSARQGLETLRSTAPDIVVTDLSMPGEDGYWLLRSIRKLSPQEGGAIPVIAVTAFRDEHGPDRARSEGFRHWLGKPVEPAVLCDTVSAACRPAA